MHADVVTISEPGGGDPRRIMVSGVRASWELSNIGSFSGFVAMADLIDAGYGDELSGKWLTWDGGGAGQWGGQVVGRPDTDGVAEIVAEGWASLPRGRVVDAGVVAIPGQPAGLARLALTSGAGEAPSYITVTPHYDEGGEPIAVDLAGRDAIEDVMPSLAGLEWYVDAARVLHMGRRIGVDCSHAVRLVDERHIVSWRTAGDRYAASPAEVVGIVSIAAEVDAVADDAASGGGSAAKTRRRRRRRKRRGGRRDRFRLGRRMTAIDYSDAEPLPGPAGSGATGWETQPQGVGANDAFVPAPRFLAPYATPMELVIVNVDGAWAACQLGNVVRVLLGPSRLNGRFRVMSRSLDTVAGTLTVAGDVQLDRWG